MSCGKQWSCEPRREHGAAAGEGVPTPPTSLRSAAWRPILPPLAVPTYPHLHDNDDNGGDGGARCPAQKMNTSSSSQGGDAHPLRPYYQPSEDTFVASAPKAKQPPSARPGHSGAGLAAASSSTAGKAHTKSATVTIPRPSTTNRYTSANDDLGGPDISTLSEWTKASVMALALQYSSTCMAMPFEVGKLLLQVQWVPKDEVYENLAREAALQGQAGRRAPAARGKSRGSDPFRDDAAIDDEDDEDDFDSQDMAPELEEWRRASDANHIDSDQEDEDEEVSLRLSSKRDQLGAVC